MKDLNDFTLSDYNYLIAQYKLLLKQMLHLADCIEPHLWNEIATSATPMRKECEKVIRYLKALRGMVK